MANTLDPMDLKQIITLHLDSSSNREIAQTLGISRNTVNNYIRLFKVSEYSFKELLSFDIGKLESLFPSRTTIKNPRYDELMRYLESIDKARHHTGITIIYHYQQYTEWADNPNGYTQF